MKPDGGGACRIGKRQAALPSIHFEPDPFDCWQPGMRILRMVTSLNFHTP